MSTTMDNIIMNGHNVNKKIAQDFLNHFGEKHNLTAIHPQSKHVIEVGYCTLDKGYKRLKKLNDKGYGIFYCINDVHGPSRKIDKLKGCRCVFQEDDDDYTGKYPVEPTFVVQSSPGKYHRYWLFRDDELMELDDFRKTMVRMVSKYGCDKNAKDSVRLLRVPGFMHNKGEDVLVEVIGGSGVRYSVSKILKKFKSNKVELNVGRKTGDQIISTKEGEWDIISHREWRHDILAVRIDLCEIFSALQHVSSESYKEWVEVGQILKSTFGNREMIFKEYDLWSQKGSTYEGTQKTLEKWRTFHHVPGITLMTEKTIFDKAYSVDWEGRIDEKTWKGLERRYKLCVVNDHFGFIAVGGTSALIRRTINDLGTVTTEFCKTDVMAQELSNVFIRKGDPKVDKNGEPIPCKKDNIAVAWSKWKNKRSYTGMTQIERKPVFTGPTTTVLPAGCFVTDYIGYTGMTREPRGGECKLIRDHILDVWCRGDVPSYEYVMGWLSTMLKKPYEKAGTCIVLKSDEGAGKGMILEPLVTMLGNGAVELHRTDDITGRFNIALYGKFFVYGNEVSWGGAKQSAGVLKGLITDSSKQYEPKFMASFPGRNICHLLLSSNSDWVVPMGVDSRRFFVLDVSGKYRKNNNDSSVDGHKYFEKLSEEIADGGIEAFVWWLMNGYDDSKYDRDTMPKGSEESQELRQNHQSYGDSFYSFWETCFEYNGIPVDGDILPLNKKETTFKCQDLHDAYRMYCNDQKLRGLKTMRVFNQLMIKTFGLENGSTQKRIVKGQNPVKVYNLEGLEIIRAKFLNRS